MEPNQPVQQPTQLTPIPPQPVTPPTPTLQPEPTKLPTIFLVLITLLSLAGLIYFYLQTQSLKQQIVKYPTPTPAASDTPTTQPSPTTDPTAKWKTYNYQNIFNIKIPPDLKIVDKGYGRIEIGNYLSAGEYQADPENCRGDCSIIESATSKSINNIDVRYLTGWWGEIGGNIAQSYIEYVIPHNGKYIYLQMQELPFTQTTSPIREKVGKVADENTRMLDQILSTFKFIDSK
ncbi:MAG: hypothetical protein E6R05_02360 [Candidatus Moraniibacteriota bacterium]|nr:MAG: hypothetical protein E6R05_02360 [Candidatus Moranbacteria bacterium]